MVKQTRKLRKDWMFGFFGFFSLFAIPEILTQDFLFAAVWLIWLVWFVYFIPLKKK